MKRTRRIEIVRYSRRVTLAGDDAATNAIASAEYLAAIENLLMSTVRAPSLSEDGKGTQAEFSTNMLANAPGRLSRYDQPDGAPVVFDAR